MAVGSLILISLFAVWGVYYFIRLLIQSVLCDDVSLAVTLVPVSRDEGQLPELLRAVGGFSQGSRTVLVDMTGCVTTPQQYTQEGLCAAVVAPGELGDTLAEIVSRQAQMH